MDDTEHIVSIVLTNMGKGAAIAFLIYIPLYLVMKGIEFAIIKHYKKKQ